jgi:endonuclease/exonuclease/phosphatase (EEP) superfamily protein YafD
VKLRWLVLGTSVAVLLVPAALLTAARVLAPPGVGWLQLVAFTPYAVPLYIVAVVLLLVAWLRGGGAWRRPVGVLVVLALVGAGVHVWWVSGAFVGTVATAGDRSRAQVMTSNLKREGADPERVVELVSRHDVDVLVLEEVTPQALKGLERAGLRRLLPHSAGEAEPRVVGTMAFSRSPLTDVRRLGTRFGGYAMDVRPEGRVDGGVLHLLAVHPYPPVGGAASWREDHRVIRRAALSRPGPTMVVGDLNATTDHAPLRELARHGFQDAATAANSGFQPTWPASGIVTRLGVPLPSLVTIDHVLVGGGLRAVRTESFEVEGTDHRALVATILL